MPASLIDYFQRWPRPWQQQLRRERRREGKAPPRRCRCYESRLSQEEAPPAAVAIEGEREWLTADSKKEKGCCCRRRRSKAGCLHIYVEQQGLFALFLRGCCCWSLVLLCSLSKSRGRRESHVSLYIRKKKEEEISSKLMKRTRGENGKQYGDEGERRTEMSHACIFSWEMAFCCLFTSQLFDRWKSRMNAFWA